MAEKKLVRATVKETLMSDLGRLERGRAYEIPEDRFTAWEKAGLCVKDSGKSVEAEVSADSAEGEKKSAGKGGKK